MKSKGRESGIRGRNPIIAGTRLENNHAVLALLITKTKNTWWV